MKTVNKKQIKNLMRKSLIRRVKALNYGLTSIVKFEGDIIRGLYKKYE